jgi:hypothetical protein
LPDAVFVVSMILGDDSVFAENFFHVFC